MFIPKFVSFTIPAGKSLQLSCVEGQIISITQISMNSSSLQPNERTVVWSTAPSEEDKIGRKIAIASLIPENDVAQVNFAFNSFSPITFSTSGTKIDITLSGYSNIMYEPKTEIV